MCRRCTARESEEGGETAHEPAARRDRERRQEGAENLRKRR